MKLIQYATDQTIRGRNLLQAGLPLGLLRLFRPRVRSDENPPRFAIIAGDVSNPSGSLGDMAMFTALMQGLRARSPKAEFTIVGMRDHRICVPGIGEVPVVATWQGLSGSLAFDRLIRTHHGLYVMGADILDGKYGAALVARIATYCNHSVRLGIPATTLGFSFNSHPRQPTIDALSRLDPAVMVNVRDQPSLERFSQLVGIEARLCADSAFLMQPAAPGEADPDTETWIAEQRAAGRIPVGVNLNAHALAPAIENTGMEALIADIATQLKSTADRHHLAYLLIPHDLKAKSGDIRMLRELETRLSASGFHHVRYIQLARPDYIKRIVGILDLVLTGRMHLAIASLGSGTPVLSITYQDKFEGLYQHFGLSLAHTIRPDNCLGQTLQVKLEEALDRRVENRTLVQSRLPAVQSLANLNLELRKP